MPPLHGGPTLFGATVLAVRSGPDPAGGPVHAGELAAVDEVLSVGGHDHTGLAEPVALPVVHDRVPVQQIALAGFR